MKTKLFLLAAIMLLQSLIIKAQTTQYEWEYVSTLQNEWLQKICTQGLDTVYIVGRNGLIAKSTDRILTWSKQYPVTTQLNDIIFCNHTTGFAVGNNGTILRTIDAGINWTPMNSGITVNLNAIAATGTDNIWAVGENGTVLFSTDAGTTWQKKDFSISASLNDVSFRNNEGYIVGNAHTCFFSSDKGSNWIAENVAINNIGNTPISTLNLQSANQTQNHTCILIGNDYKGSSINIDNNVFRRPLNQGGYFTSFVMKNDSIGYGFWGGYTTGSGYTIYVEIININKTQGYIPEGFELQNPYFDDQHSDINFVNDSIEYIISGPSLFHLKRYFPDIIDGLNNNINKKLSIKNNSNNLDIQFENTKVEKIELYSITGLKILSENITVNETSKSINITDLSKGTYIIRTYNRDNTYVNIKWIKQ